MLLEPPVEEMIEIVGNKYKLCNLVAKRADEIRIKNLSENVESKENEITIAANEVYNGTIVSDK